MCNHEVAIAADDADAGRGGGARAMPEDRIERDIAIAATPAQVWAALTEAGAVSAWLGGGKPAQVELRPGGAIVVDHGAHGSLLARFERVEAPRYLSFRWSQGRRARSPRTATPPWSSSPWNRTAPEPA
jgi:uncharacterized protein YndB with AHSA1/START domain